MMVASGAEEAADQRRAATATGIALATVARIDIAEHLLDVLAAAGVGGTITTGADGSGAHTP